SSFLKQLPPAQFQQLFEHLPGIYFFAKDRESRLMCASQPILDRLGVPTEADVVGTDDYDYFPPQIADSFVRDDREVMKTGQPMINRVEIWYNEQRLLDWFVTNKLPLRNVAGEIVGIMGMVQSYEGKKESLLPYSQISEAVDYIRQHHCEKIGVEELAQRVGISSRQLHRKFRQVFGMSVQDFLAKTRIQAASDALIHQDRTIAEIAATFGFCDQSAFTLQFRKHTGMTPIRFRQRYRKG
ncbi:MAG: AraC family transcriptional regulator, partial [Verrucomicrobiota bacterium]